MALLFLLSHQRSGSHFLKSALDRCNSGSGQFLALPEVFTPGIAAMGPQFKDWLFEPFHNERLVRDPLKWGTPQGIAETAASFIDHLEEKSRDITVLADIKLNQLHIGEGWYHQTTTPPKLIDQMLARGKVIFLQRRNLVRAIVSALQATKTGIWHVESKDAGTPVMIRIDDISGFLFHLEHLHRGLVEADKWLAGHPSVHRVYYEDLFSAGTLEAIPQAFDDIADFAEIRRAAAWKSSFRKIGTRPLSDVVANFDDLRAKILPTKYAARVAEE